MEKEFIITSTNTIEGGEILKYYGVINNNVVVGTNLFSDIGASFLDVFGGSSSSYQNKLKNIYDTSIQNLKVKARELGSNAILGLSIDFDEISGGGKSMFMISVSGTAVFIKNINDKENLNLRSDNTISNDILKNEMTKNLIISKIENNKSLTQEEWFFLQQNPNSNITKKIINRFIKAYDDVTYPSGSDKGKQLLNNVSNYFRVIDRKEAVEILYSKLIENSDKVVDLIKKNQLLSPEKVIELIEKGDYKIAIKLLDIDKNNYSNTDLNNMKTILNQIDSLENKGSIKISKSLMGKDKEKYICPNGHSNDIENEHCTYANCSQNIKGLTENEVEKIEELKIKSEILDDLFNQN